MKKAASFLALSVLLAFFCQVLSAQNQDPLTANAPKRDVFVILDVSGSMINQNKFGNVRDYIDAEVIGGQGGNGLLKTGDSFSLITFGDDARERLTKIINSDADKAALRSEFAKIQPDNNYTDIGMAMEKLAEVLGRSEEKGVRRVILFITDGLNAPPPGSPYSGKDLSVDERFKSLGEKISKSGWFLYVIGIGGQTDAEAIAAAVPGSQMLTTDSSLGGVDVEGFASQVDAQAAAREEAEAAAEAARKAEEAANSGIQGFFNGVSGALGLPIAAVLGILLFIILLIVLAIIILRMIFKTVEVVITDEKETIIKKLAPFAGILLNSPGGFLPALGVENSQVLRIERSAFGLKVNVNDEAVIADNSPYKKRGSHPLKGVINLANGRLIRATLR